MSVGRRGRIRQALCVTTVPASARAPPLTNVVSLLPKGNERRTLYRCRIGSATVIDLEIGMRWLVPIVAAAIVGAHTDSWAGTSGPSDLPPGWRLPTAAELADS